MSDSINASSPAPEAQRAEYCVSCNGTGYQGVGIVCRPCKGSGWFTEPVPPLPAPASETDNDATSLRGLSPDYVRSEFLSRCTTRQKSCAHCRPLPPSDLPDVRKRA
jgi:hypothetical protein